MTLQRLSGAIGCLVTVVMAMSCGGSGASGDSQGGGTVEPGSRLAWDQPAADAGELAALHFVMYIDNVRTELTAASCSTPAGSAGFPCTSPLPAMSSGQHTIQLASYIVGTEVLESARSASLVITLAGSIGTTAGAPGVEPPAAAAPDQTPSAPRELVTRDGARLRIAPFAQADRPAALAVSEDGAVFIAEASGAIRIVRDGVVTGELTLTAAEADGSAVLDLALDPEFARNHFVYVLQAEAGPPPTFRLSRFREAGGRLGERAVVFDAVPAWPERPSAAMAFGTDARLYIALDDGGDAEAARRPGSYNGKLLRLNADGTTPHDQISTSPIFAAGLQAPRSLAWDAATSALFVADVGTRRAARIRSSSGRGVVIAPYRLPLADGATSVALYRGALIPELQGSLLIAPAADAAYLLRVRFSDNDQRAIAFTEPLAVTADGFVRLVEAGPDGAIYVGTDREILRITPR